MAAAPTCPRCHSALGADAPEGLCPRCLVALNLAGGTNAEGAVGPGGTRVLPRGAEPLAASEVAKHFPQLEILDCLGRGGMGVVYKARQPRLDRFVALKILAPEKEKDPQFADRFAREAQALARLNHPNIVAVHDFGQTDGLFYLLMEFVDGVNLRELLQSGRLPPEQALAIVPRICEALQFAHEHGVVHRDIKPENVLLDKAGQVKIADFGIAKIVTTGPAPALTQDQQVIGTPHYMAPEQVEKPQLVDHRADIFSLGVVFYEMLTGELPLGKFAPPSRKVQVDVRLDDVVLRALEKEPERRYQRATDVKTDLESIKATPEKEYAAWERRAPGWRIRCVKCGFSEHFGKYGIRLGAVGRSYTFGRCARCGKIRIHAIERGPADHNAATRPPADRERLNAFPNATRVARWTARIFSVLLLAFYSVFILAEGLPAIANQPGGVQLNFLALGVMFAGFVVGWRRDGTAALLIAAGWTLWQVSEGKLRPNLFQTPLPIALLYAFCWWTSQGRRTVRLAIITAEYISALAIGMLICPANVFVSGRVIDAATGAGVAGAELRLVARETAGHDRAGAPNARSGGDGRFRLYVGWYSPQQLLTVQAPGHLPITKPLGPRPFGERRLSRDYPLVRLHAPEELMKLTPPVVVSTTPQSGLDTVEPGETELRFTFSKPMRPASFSLIAADAGSSPRGTSAPSFTADRRTCTWRVTLEPGRTYALWLNNAQFGGFQDDDGHGAVPYLLVFQTRSTESQE